MKSPLSVDAWYQWPASLSDRDVEAYGRLLSADERRRRDRFVREDDRRAYAVAHGLARQALSRYGSLLPEAWRFETDEHGKPFVVSEQAGAPRLEFNLSHARTIVACVVTRGTPVGVDVEGLNSTSAARDAAVGYFASIEQQMLDQCLGSDHPARVIEVWTLKEAYLKALGKGLSVPLDSFAFVFDGSDSLRVEHASATSRCHFVMAAPSADTRMAIAVLGDEAPLLTIHDETIRPASAPTLVRRSAGVGVKLRSNPRPAV